MAPRHGAGIRKPSLERAHASQPTASLFDHLAGNIGPDRFGHSISWGTWRQEPEILPIFADQEHKAGVVDVYAVPLVRRGPCVIDLVGARDPLDLLGVAGKPDHPGMKQRDIAFELRRRVLFRIDGNEQRLYMLPRKTQL